MKKTKYRVKQIGIDFYPQYKNFLFWHNVTFPSMYLNNYCSTRGLSFVRVPYKVFYKRTLNLAEDLLDKYIDCKKFKYSYKKHKIIKIYNNAAVLIYLDVSKTVTDKKYGGVVYPLYNSNLNALEHMIDDFERDLKLSKVRTVYLYKLQ